MTSKYTAPALRRFHSYVSSPTGKRGCRIWRGYLDKDGYGRIRMDGVRLHAHHVACELERGPAPTPLHQACHTCDEPWCVEGSHLFWGTVQGNHIDAVMKGRKKPNRVRRKLTPSDVVAIRKAGGSCITIGKQFGVSAMMVSKIKRRLAWDNITDDGVEVYDDVQIVGR